MKQPWYRIQAYCKRHRPESPAKWRLRCRVESTLDLCIVGYRARFYFLVSFRKEREQYGLETISEFQRFIPIYVVSVKFLFQFS